MEHYPDIQRRDGTLFFIPHGNRAAIAMSIERLIDLLDAAEGDPDLEANGDERDQSYAEGGDTGTNPLEDDEDGSDDEPTLGASNDYVCRSQEDWPRVWGQDECEVENEDGGDILDEPHDDDELDQNGDETDYCGSEDEWRPYEPDALYDGTGSILAAEMLLRAKTRREPYSEIIGTRHHLLKDGSIFTTLVPR
ncbi:hypothetical protein GB928_018750 [Shinella curvata]|uniref:Uncharacterized protein n=1 Tax=Shinella curvata TaxID=1817964 RepID=A0ABT8XHL5_9HYPH|nr:hypothetical protein [Shinella curvata]MCJ8053900.1 hypothetical protein [Shinella curvata]MDO6123232.1 hypothetical protein [Shinella curvata]